jgi:hypothetical protein
VIHKVTNGVVIAGSDAVQREATPKMTLRIEKVREGPITTIRLIGRIQAEHLEEVRAQIEGSGTWVALDLEEVSLVDVDTVRFLGACQAEGIRLLQCSPYINDWIAKERGQDGQE